MEWYHILLIVLVVLAILLVVLYFVGRKLQKKADAQQQMIEQYKTTMSVLVIDKKKQKVKDSKLPKQVQEQIPKYLRGRKMPMVMAKVGPKVTTFLCDDKVFDIIPVKQEVKVDIAGMYIVAVKGGKKISASAKTEAKAPAKISLKDRIKNPFKK